MIPRGSNVKQVQNFAANSEDPVTFHVETSEKGEEEQGPNRNYSVPTASRSQQRKKNEERKHGQRITRYADNPGRAGEEQPIADHPDSIRRSQLYERNDRGDEAKNQKQQILHTGYCSSLSGPVPSHEKLLSYAYPGPREGLEPMFPMVGHEYEWVAMNMVVKP